MTTTPTWNKEAFQASLMADFEAFAEILAINTGDWVIKGFIDVYRNIYTISVDTKVVSKLIELMLSEYQNHYPDVSLVAADGTRIVLDLKSTYRTNPTTVNGFTLGAFTGYFRDRTSTKNVTFPYATYAAHFVLGIIYTRTDESIDERRVYKLDDLLEIASVVKDFQFLLREKWRIASDHPGSGNTKNIGSVRDIERLVEGQGPFAVYGEAVFSDYWMNYLTNDMARAIESNVPYRNLAEYLQWRERAPLPR
jgi:hypothetical protein